MAGLPVHSRFLEIIGVERTVTSITSTHSRAMARGSTSKPKPSKYAELDDGILDEDSEEDEFANYKASVKKASKGRQPPSDDEDEDDEEMMDEDDDEDEDMDSNDERLMYEDSDDEGDGVGVYEPDEWDGGADYSSSEDEDEDDERAQMVRFSTTSCASS